MSGRYARGRRALAECQRSGKRVPYQDLVEDGHIPGLLVAPDWYEPKHPQETPVVATDPTSLHRPSPEYSLPTGEGVLGAATPNLLYQPSTTLAFQLRSDMVVLPVNTAVVAKYGTPIWVALVNGTWKLLFVGAPIDTPTFNVPLQSSPGVLPSNALAGAAVYIGPLGNGILI